MSKNKIAAVIVTYNRKQLLGECIDGLLNQTYPLDAIYIIDNASTDGTAEYLIEKGYIKNVSYSSKNPSVLTTALPIPRFLDRVLFIHYIRMSQNTGGAGGFHEGVKRGYKDGFDWLWLMDDDIKPKEDCLENLLKYKDYSKCIHPRKVYPDGTPYNWEGYLDIITGKRVSLNDISFRNGKDFCCVNFGCFEGMLIHREVVNKIGYPDRRFFIVYDDTIYGWLANFYTNVFYVRDAIVTKLINKGSNILSDSFIYYSMRNYFLRIDYLNRYVSKYKIFRYLTLIGVFVGYIIYILLKRDKKISAFKYLVKGFTHGLKSRYGRL